MVSSGLILSNRYLLRCEIAAGGMGSVYEAVDLHTGAQVAVKVVHPLYAHNRDYIARLRREAQIAALIHSHTVVKVLDLAEHEGTTYLVMEYVGGETLAETLDRKGRLPAHEALNICIAIARALEGAHAVGVVHRDLKPQNVKITDEGEVKVLDFGIARAEALPGITRTGLFVGTPDYSAPERGAGQADIRSDIYSLGVILYELLGGRPPFTGTTPIEVLRKHEVAPVPPLPVAVPRQVQAVLDRTLAKRPEERYQTPGELLAALHAARDAATGAAGAATAQSIPRIDRRRLTLIGGLALAFVLAAGAAVVLARVWTSTAPISGSDAAASPTTVPTLRSFLVPRQRITLDLRDEKYLPHCLGPDGRPRVKSVLRITAIEADESGRVGVSFVSAVPQVSGVPPADCRLLYNPDLSAPVSATLELTTQSGQIFEVPLTGGSGLAVDGADELYGREFAGVWWFDGVDLDSVALALLKRLPERRGVFHRIDILPPAKRN